MAAWETALPPAPWPARRLAYFAGEGACFTSTVTAPATPGLTVNTWPARVS